jgi:uncharacterized SAM-binding protein YcdF (DUF218 family)
MTTVRILLVAALTILGMVVMILGLVPVAPEQAPQAAAAALLAVAVAVVLVLGALVRDLAEVPEEVQELEAQVLRAVQAQEVRDSQVPVKVNQEEVRFHPQEEEARLRAAVQSQEQSVGKKTQPRHQVGSLKARQMAMVVVKAEEARSKKANKKK